MKKKKLKIGGVCKKNNDDVLSLNIYNYCHLIC